MIKLLISLRQIRPGQSGGIAPYARALTEHLAQRDDVELHLVETFYNHKHYCDVPGHVIRHNLLNPGRYNDDIIATIAGVQPDVVFYPVPGDPIAKVGQERYVVCIADLQHATFPDFFSEGDVLARDQTYGEVAERADRIVTLSAHSRGQICERYGLSAQRVRVVSPALAGGFGETADLPTLGDLVGRFGVPNEYLFYPANFWKHKNHTALFEAVALLKSEGRPVTLVLTGELSDQRPDLRELIVTLDIASQILPLGFVSDDELESLIRNSRMVVFPSLFEGFGIPVLEALRCGVPVCCSNTTSLPEVGGDAAVYFDPEEPSSIARSIKLLLDDRNLVERLGEQAPTQVAKFNYAQSAQDLYNCMCEALEVDALLETGPLVTVVTPSLNQAEFILPAIHSVLNQTYENIECIVVDGGSQDNTVDLLRQVTDDRFRYISEPDDGQTDAINKGLRLSQGEYQCYLNSDDTLEPNAIAEMVRYLIDHPAVDIVYGDADYVDAAGSFIQPYDTRPWNFEEFKGHCFICQPATMWRRATIEKYGYFDQTLHFVMDYEFWLRVAKLGGKLSYLPMKLANSRLYQETKTMSARGKVFAEIVAVTKTHFGKTHPSWTLQQTTYMIHEKYNLPTMYGFARYLAVGLAFVLNFTQILVYAYQTRVARRLERWRTRFGGSHAGQVAAGAGDEVQKAVIGLYSDGWVSERLTVSYGDNKYLSRLRIEGRSPVVQVIGLEVDGARHEHSVDIGSFEIDVSLERAHARRVEVFAGGALKESAGRSLGFQLTYTNLFSDIDVAWR